ncbi:MAG: P-loop NTPase [Candidatus Omnitrophota bacterium]
MKIFFIRLRRNIVFYLAVGLIVGFWAGAVFLLYNPILYATSVKLTLSDIGRDIFEKLGFTDKPEKILYDEKFDFLSQQQKEKIDFFVAFDHKGLTIETKGQDPAEIFKLTNDVAESYAALINNESKNLKEQRDSQGLEKIQAEYNKYKEESDKLQEELNRLEPKLDTLEKQEKMVGDSQKALEERVASLEIRKSNLLRIYTESHPEVIGINLELDTLNKKLGELPVVEGVNNLRRDILQKKARYVELKETIGQISKQKEYFLQTVIQPLISIERYEAEPANPVGSLSMSNVYKISILSGLLISLIFSIIMAGVKDVIVFESEISNIPNLPLIATVPFLKPKRGIDIGAHLLFLYDDSSEYVNAYRNLTTHIKLDAFKDNIEKKAIVISSPRDKTGKSTVSANLALTLARLGKSVVLVDANLNKPSVSKFFGIKPKEPGISDILTGKSSLESSLKGITDMLLAGIDWNIATKTYGLDRLMILPSGGRVSNPAGLLESNKVSELFKQLRERFECIIVDSPSLLKNPDSIILSANADGIFLVCKISSTSYRDVVKCSRKLTELKIQSKGCILAA